jgi:hypothetical protein
MYKKKILMGPPLTGNIVTNIILGGTNVTA